MSPAARKRLLAALKIALAAVLLAWLFAGVRWHDEATVDEAGQATVHIGLASSLQRAGAIWLVGTVGAFWTAMGMVALRWRLLLAAQGVRLTVVESLKLTLLGDFLSMVMPGTIGGDAAKAYFVLKNTSQKSTVLVGTVADRLIGLCALAGVALVMLIATWALGLLPWQALRAAAVSVAAAVAGIAAALAVLLSARVRSALGLRKLFGHPALARYVSGAGRAAHVLARNGRALAAAGALSVVSQGLQVCGILLIGLGLGLSLDWYAYFLYVPIIFIVAAVPLTPGGLGVAEQLYLLYLSAAGQRAEVLALALLARLALILSVLPGAVVLARGPKLPAAETIQMEIRAVEAPAH